MLFLKISYLSYKAIHGSIGNVLENVVRFLTSFLQVVFFTLFSIYLWR